jgi:hypothetical protein
MAVRLLETQKIFLRELGAMTVVERLHEVAKAPGGASLRWSSTLRKVDVSLVKPG